MNVLLFNGSSKAKGCTNRALQEIEKELNDNGIDTEIICIGGVEIRDCNGCGACRNNNGYCFYDDDAINEYIEKAKLADGFIFGTPVYYAHPSGRLLSVMDRMFYAGSQAFKYKPGAAIASARRAGTTASIDVLNKYMTFACMPIVSSSYWNGVHGNNSDEVEQDLEGLQTMRNLGNNMAWLLKSIEAGKQAGIRQPQPEKENRTNFIR
jgi:multimeric flavodoxin WrbA